MAAELRARCLRLGCSALLAVGPLLSPADRQPAERVTRGLRLVVLERDDGDPADWNSIHALGANVVATLRPPSAETDRLASANGLAYLAFLTTEEIESLSRDPTRVLEARAEQSLAGFYYWDSEAPEGLTSPRTQQRAYTALKELFPDKLVLYPTRLDPIAWDSGFLDRFFRPEFTDLVTPYFYPVGTTILGQAHQRDAWSDRLAGLLSTLAPRIPAGKGVLPVLQGFEQTGYPVDDRFPLDQMSVYRRFWPGLSSAAIFAWKFSEAGPGPLVELADRPSLQRGVCGLFAALAGPPPRCGRSREVPWR